MSATVHAWLADRNADVPASLAQRMTDAADVASMRDVATAPDVANARDASVADILGAAALVCLRAAMPRCDERAAALDLLAADALITYACEAAADDDDPAALDALCARYTTARLAAEAATT